jgi:hypothetical protein
MKAVITTSIVIDHVSFLSVRSYCSVSHAKRELRTLIAVTSFFLCTKKFFVPSRICIPLVPYCSKVSRSSGSILAFRICSHLIVDTSIKLRGFLLRGSPCLGLSEDGTSECCGIAQIVRKAQLAPNSLPFVNHGITRRGHHSKDALSNTVASSFISRVLSSDHFLNCLATFFVPNLGLIGSIGFRAFPHSSQVPTLKMISRFRPHSLQPRVKHLPCRFMASNLLIPR